MRSRPLFRFSFLAVLLIGSILISPAASAHNPLAFPWGGFTATKRLF